MHIKGTLRPKPDSARALERTPPIHSRQFARAREQAKRLRITITEPNNEYRGRRDSVEERVGEGALRLNIIPKYYVYILCLNIIPTYYEMLCLHTI